MVIKLVDVDWVKGKRLLKQYMGDSILESKVWGSLCKCNSTLRVYLPNGFELSDGHYSNPNHDHIYTHYIENPENSLIFIDKVTDLIVSEICKSMQKEHSLVVGDARFIGSINNFNSNAEIKNYESSFCGEKTGSINEQYFLFSPEYVQEQVSYLLRYLTSDWYGMFVEFDNQFCKDELFEKENNKNVRAVYFSIFDGKSYAKLSRD